MQRPLLLFLIACLFGFNACNELKEPCEEPEWIIGELPETEGIMEVRNGDQLMIRTAQFDSVGEVLQLHDWVYFIPCNAPEGFVAGNGIAFTGNVYADPLPQDSWQERNEVFYIDLAPDARRIQCIRGIDYTPGNVVFNGMDSISTANFFAIVDSIADEIMVMENKVYRSDLPPDSNSVIVNTLLSKPYVLNDIITNPANNGNIWMRFQNMDKADRQDWLETMERFQLRDIPINGVFFFQLSIEEGRECEARDVLIQQPWIIFAVR